MGRYSVGSTQDYEPQKVKVLRVGGERICVALHEGKFYAFEDRCTHDGAPLDDAPIEDEQVICPRHGARFCLRTGEALTPPAYEPLRIFRVREDDGRILVEVPQP